MVSRVPPSIRRSWGVRTPRGVALVEVAAAAILLAIGLGAVIGLTGAAMSSQAQGRHLAEAAMLADEQLSLVLARGPDDYSSRFGSRGRCDAPFDDYRYELSFDSPGGGAAGSSTPMDPYDVTATIFWEGRGGRERSISVSTLIASRLGDDPDPDRRPTETVERLQ